MNHREALTLNTRLLLAGLKLIALLSIAFVIISVAPQYAHHLLLVIAAALCSLGGGALLTYRTHADWVETTGRITRIEERQEEVAISEYSRMSYYYPVVEYEYIANGVILSGNVVSREKENVWVPESGLFGDPVPPETRWWMSLNPGDEIPVFVNPSNANEAVLVRSLSKLRRSHHLALLMGGVLLATVWLVLVSL